MKRYATVDEYILGNEKWQELLLVLREIINSTELSEEVKWGVPSYSYAKKNLVGLAAFKNYVAIWFHQGALLSDPHQVLINAQEGKTKALRQLRFTTVEEIDQGNITAYIEETIQNQKDGKKIKADKDKPVVIPEELLAAFDKDSDLKSAFESFTPGKQREFADHISSAKRVETKQKRLDKVIPMILDGKGLNDRYR